MKKILLTVNGQAHPIMVGRGLLSRFGEFACSLRLGSDAVIVTNPHIRKLYGPTLQAALSRKKISVKFYEVPDSEKSKSPKVAFDLIDKIARYDVQRKIFIVALGIGVS